MRIIINVMLLCDDSSNRCISGAVRKEYKCTAIPIPGMDIEDEAWDEPRRIQAVLLNPEGDYYWIEFDDHCPTLEQCERAKERYELNGWKRPGH